MITRRQALISAAALSAGMPFMGLARAADTWPSKPIRFVLPFASGGSADLIGRPIADKLSAALGQNVLIDNRPGAGGTIGTTMAAHAEPDGYTWLMANNNTFAFNLALYSDVPYDPVKDFTPISEIARVPLIMMINPSFPAKTVAEFIDHVKANPGKYSYGSAGIGSGGHIAAAYFCSQAGLEMTHVPYKGSSGSLPDLLGNRIHLTMTGSGALSYVRSGQLLGLGVTSPDRAVFAPDVPAIAESLPGYEFMLWYGLVLPAKVSPEIADRVHQELAKVMAMPEITQSLTNGGMLPVATSSPAEFGAYIKSEVEHWVPVIKSAGITAG